MKTQNTIECALYTKVIHFIVSVSSLCSLVIIVYIITKNQGPSSCGIASN